MKIEVVDGIPDYARIIDLIKAEWPAEFGEKPDSEKIADMIESHNTDKDRAAYLFDEGEIVGFSRYSLWPRDARSTDAAHTYDIVVLPSVQGRGLGMMLMNDMISDCRNRGLKRLYSRTFKSNTASIAMHRKAGFRVNLETDDSIVWELIL